MCWLRSTAIAGFVILYGLALMYYHHGSGIAQDHVLHKHDSWGSFAWFELHPLFVLSLVCIGAGFEAAYKVNNLSSQKLGTFEQNCLIYGLVFNCLISHILRLIHMDRRRSFRLFPKQATLCFVLIPLATTMSLFCGFAMHHNQKIYAELILLAALVVLNSLYHVYLATQLFLALIRLSFSSDLSSSGQKEAAVTVPIDFEFEPSTLKHSAEATHGASSVAGGSEVPSMGSSPRVMRTKAPHSNPLVDQIDEVLPSI
eukprot:TRINITY_DN4164_c0_g1_i4.p1 TRINITY_DN4164_c0_g1~~TRINITY_DN4164_c0_g1_i4.p1  ORF type:complete len:257 (+),score=50.25 TRINITY_DN4164_c0_g1_i4:473-1243(+)